MILVAAVPLPPSVNHLYANVPGKGRVKSKRYKAWISEAGAYLRIAIRSQQIQGPYTLTVSAGKPAGRRRDLGNLEKALSDLLVSMGAVADDSRCEAITLRWVSNRPDALLTVVQCKAVPAYKPGAPARVEWLAL